MSKGWFYAEAVDTQGRRVEFGPFEPSQLAVALERAKHLVEGGFHGAVVVEYERIGRTKRGLIRERRVLNAQGEDVTRAYWLRQRGARS
jgi:hypothetical protein